MGKRTLISYTQLNLARLLCEPEAGIGRFTPDYTDKGLVHKMKVFSKPEEQPYKKRTNLPLLIYINFLESTTHCISILDISIAAARKIKINNCFCV